MTKRAILYARVSSDDTRKEGRNLQGQLEMYRTYCREKGYRVVAELAEDDRGASGASWDLPQLNKALDMARAGEFDVLVTRELDRFARSLAKQLVIEGEFKRYGVEIEYCLGEYPDTPEGNLQKHVKGAIAEYEREKINERMVRGRRNVVKDGNVMAHGNATFGYEIHKEGAKTSLVICEREAAIVRQVFDLYIGDDKPSISEVAKRMAGTPTCADLRQSPSNPKIREYGKWSIGSVSNILDNRTYTGIWMYGGDPELTVKVPAIVSVETWKTTQERKKHNAQHAKRNVKYQYLMGKRLTCGECGSKLVGRAKRNGEKLYLYYVCQAKYRFAKECTVSRGFRADAVDGAIWDWLKTIFLHPDNFIELLREGLENERIRTKPLQDRLAVIGELLEENQEQLAKLLDLYLDGDFPKEWLTERKVRLEQTGAALDKEGTGLRASLKELGQWAISDEDIETSVRDYIDGWQDFVEELDRLEELDPSDPEVFAVKHEAVESTNLEATLVIDENGQQVIHLRCLLGEKTLPVESTDICSR